MPSDSVQPIRILRIIARLNIGGPAIHVTLLTKKLAPPDYESILLCGMIGETEGDMTYYAAQHDVEPRIMAELGREISPIRDLATIWKLYRLIRELKPDIVHTHTAKAGFVGRLAAKMAGVPVIIHTFHGHVFRGYFNETTTRLFILLERVAASVSDTVITLTEGLRRELADEFKITRRSRITVLPLGLDLEPFVKLTRNSGGFREKYGIPADAPLIGLIGRFVPVKNHALFLTAAAKLRDRLPGVCFALVGDGELRAEIEAQIDSLGLRDCVTITGWIEDTTPVYAALDALAISSVNEGTPVTVIEALAAGVRVAATAVGGVPDLLDQGQLGMLVPSGDSDALADALYTLVTTPQDAGQIAQSQALMLDRYGIDRLVRDLDGVYRGLLLAKGIKRG